MEEGLVKQANGRMCKIVKIRGGRDRGEPVKKIREEVKTGADEEGEKTEKEE